MLSDRVIVMTPGPGRVKSVYELGSLKNIPPLERMEQEAFNRLQTVMEEAGELKGRVDFISIVDNSWAEKKQ